jgi:hypothetical protein
MELNFQEVYACKIAGLLLCSAGRVLNGKPVAVADRTLVGSRTQPGIRGSLLQQLKHVPAFLFEVLHPALHRVFVGAPP